MTQSAVIKKAWENSGVDPETISYIEGHATGTVIGDPIEINGIKMAFALGLGGCLPLLLS